MLTSIDTAIKHFERRKEQMSDGRVNASEVIQILNAMKQFEADNQIMVGVAYTRYDGVEFKDTSFDMMYEGGFAVINKEEAK